MARFTSGWVPTKRDYTLGDIGRIPQRHYLLAALQAMANWGGHVKPEFVDWGGVPREVKIGDVVTSTLQLAEMCKVDRKTVGRYLNYLRLRGILTVQKKAWGIWVTFLNLDDIRADDAVGAHPPPSHRDNRRPHTEEVNNPVLVSKETSTGGAGVFEKTPPPAEESRIELCGTAAGDPSPTPLTDADVENMVTGFLAGHGMRRKSATARGFQAILTGLTGDQVGRGHGLVSIGGVVGAESFEARAGSAVPG